MSKALRRHRSAQRAAAVRAATLLLAAVLAAVLAVAPAAQAAPGLTGAALQGALTGVWCNSADGGKSCWAHDQFFRNGRFRACGRNSDDGMYFEGSGRFQVEGIRMCYVVDSATDSFWVRPGSRFCTDIVDIDTRQHRYRDIESGESFLLFRREGLAEPCAQHR